ncbi:tyrosine-type recombinase/integrase [Curtobacterium sp. 314Chir4.1]|uniref:tyrosine-type recombinase/integrase n=1 Tax=Curtobacterium sp. 314Chir4.1 TaxID=1279028 RepID=UPI0020D206E2|nr:tyrosine-type recombinase/integrase [Curtobacterium sp. 314Chir4.1]
MTNRFDTFAVWKFAVDAAIFCATGSAIAADPAVSFATPRFAMTSDRICCGVHTGAASVPFCSHCPATFFAESHRNQIDPVGAVPEGAEVENRIRGFPSAAACAAMAAASRTFCSVIGSHFAVSGLYRFGVFFGFPFASGVMSIHRLAGFARDPDGAVTWTMTSPFPAGHTPHDLRHYYASGLIANGADVVTVQRALGHANAATTLSTYSHLWADAEDRTRAAAANLMRSSLRSADSSRTDRAN